MRYSMAIAAAASVTALLALPASAATFQGYDVNLVEAATVLGNGDLQLNAVSNYSRGAAWLAPTFSTANSFSVSFAFSLQQLTDNPMADGISFALQNTGTGAIGSNGGGIGYAGMDAVGSIVQSFANNSIGFNTSGQFESGSERLTLHNAPANLGAASLVLGTQTVHYDAVTKMLSMTGTLNVDGTTYNVSDSVGIDLSARFGSTIYAGFTGATGGSIADQRITSLAVAAVPEPESYALMLGGLAIIGWTLGRGKGRLAPLSSEPQSA